MIDGKITELLQTKGMEYDETSASWYVQFQATV